MQNYYNDLAKWKENGLMSIMTYDVLRVHHANVQESIFNNTNEWILFINNQFTLWTNIRELICLSVLPIAFVLRELGENLVAFHLQFCWPLYVCLYSNSQQESSC